MSFTRRQPALVAHGLSYPATRQPTSIWGPRPRQKLEEHLQQKIITVAQLLGWDHHHDYDARHSTPGWPDLELVRPPRYIRAEIKYYERDRELKGEQKRIMGLLREVPGLEAYVWTQRDLDSGLIVQILARRS